MKRYEIINSLAKINQADTYLEVGVEAGHTFSKIAITNKTAVDPIFRFDFKSMDGSFHQTTSDEFLLEAVSKNAKFDFIFLDGLHHWEFALRDFINATLLSHKKTIIIIDDVLPSDYFSQLRSQSDCVKFKKIYNIKDENWMGDVYKIIPMINLLFSQWSYFTLKLNHGQTVLFQMPRNPPLLLNPSLMFDFEDILYEKIPYNFCSYEDLEFHLTSVLS